MVDTSTIESYIQDKGQNHHNCHHNDRQQDSLYTLSFENLTVHVPGGASTTSKSRQCWNAMNNPFRNFLQEYFGLSVLSSNPIYALDNVSGYVQSGELCLILGPEQQSKSTLLRALSGRLNPTDELSGTILLNGMPMARSYQGWRRLCPYVSPSDTSHSAVLTVRETFEFAAKCTCSTSTSSSPSSSTAQSENENDIEERVNEVMVELGLDGVADTVVGDENLRGVSGGQKRRVTVGEMMFDDGDTSTTRFMCCDSITDGLSSSDSISLIEKFATACHTQGYAAFISLLQPSDEMIELFDKILVLTSCGELAYFGPVNKTKLKSIFLDLKKEEHENDGTDTGASDDDDDYDGSIADLVLRQSLGTNPSEQEEKVVKRYANSSIAKDTVTQLSLLRSQAPPARSQDVRSLLPTDRYPTTYWYQFNIIADRRLKLISRNAVTWTRVGIAILFGVIIGSLFSALDNSITGALARTGYLFLNCFLVLMLSAAVTIPSSFRERVTLFKHRSAEFYDGRIAYVAQVITDAPLSILEAILLSTISYFWVDMNSSKTGKFIYFVATLVALECAGQALGRLLCALCRKQVTANAMSSIIILIFGTVGGFMPSYDAIHPVLQWLSWVTPVSYAFEGLMINQFQDQPFDPLLSINSNGPMMTEVGGNQWLQLYSLPRNDNLSPNGVKAFNMFMVFFFAIFYDLLGFYFVEKTRGWYHNQTRRPQSTVKNSFSMGGGQASFDDTHNNSQASPELETVAERNDTWPQCLSVQDLSYEVPINRKDHVGINIHAFIQRSTIRWAGKSKGQGEKLDNSSTSTDSKESRSSLRLLRNVNARFGCGRMAALMGTSGAGKTTLMDVIAGYKTGGTIAGNILIDGAAKCYAEQQDILNPYLSVIETLRFTSNCRLKRNVDKEKVIKQVIHLMNLKDWTDYVVGKESEGEGLPKHARKRLTIAIELVGQPKILFLDEPTTGLGSNAASMVIDAVRRATDVLHLITVATMHQPSKIIWDSFDDAILLTRGGRVTYMGETGRSSKTVLDYFVSVGNEIPPTRCNPADFCLAVINKLEPEEASAAFEKSQIGETLKATIAAEMTGCGPPPDIDKKPSNGFFREFLLLTVRHMIVQWRNPSYCMMRIISSIVMSFYIGVLFIADKSTIEGAVFSIGAIFFLVFVLVIPMQAAVVPLVEDRAVLYRETTSGQYSRIAYALGQLVADQPFHLLNTLLMYIMFYFLVDFKTSAEEMGYFLLTLYLSNWVIQSIGQLFALATPNEESANGLGGLSVILSVVLMGFLITVNAMPDGWVWACECMNFGSHLRLEHGLMLTSSFPSFVHRTDIDWCNLFHYILQGLVTNELAGSSYSIDLIGLLPDITAEMPNGILAFGNGNDSQSVEARQVASVISLALEAPDGINPDTRSLPGLINCTVAMGCFADNETAIFDSFMECYIFNGLRPPPCRDEFGTVVSNVNITDVLECFVPEDRPASVPTRDGSPFIPADFSEDDYGAMNDDSRLDLVLCLMKALLPQDKLNAIQELIETIEKIVGLLVFVLEIIQNGIDIPGELILFFFGWAEYSEGEGIVAPFKYWYCLGAVAIFLGGIEIFKLIAIRFIVWTKR